MATPQNGQTVLKVNIETLQRLYVIYFFSVNCIVVNPSQPGVAFHIETSHLICTANQVTGFYMEYNTGLKWVKRGKGIAK